MLHSDQSQRGYKFRKALTLLQGIWVWGCKGTSALAESTKADKILLHRHLVFIYYDMWLCYIRKCVFSWIVARHMVDVGSITSSPKALP